MSMVLPRQSNWRRLWWTHPELSLAAVAAAAWLAVLTVHIATGPFQAAAQHSSTLMPEQAMPGHHHGTSKPGIAGHQSVTSGPGSAPIFLLSVGLWVVMATAIRLGVEGGRLAARAGRIPRRLYAQASTPEDGVAQF